MAKYRVTDPNGDSWDITAPDSATEQEVMERAKSHWASQPQKNNYQQVADEMSTGQRFMAGIGGGMMDLYTGAKQRLGLADQSEVDDLRQASEGLGTAGKVGNVIGQGALAAPAAFIPGANAALGSTLTGAALGMLQPTLEGESVLGNTVMGATGGYVGNKIGGAIGNALKGTRNTATAAAGGGKVGAKATITGKATAKGSGGGYNYGSLGDDASAGLNVPQQRLLAEGKKLGLKATPGQASGSRALMQLEAKAEAQPMTSGTFNAIKANNQRAVNRTVAQALGESSDVVDDSLLAKVHDRLGKIYSDVADDTPRTIDPDQFLNKLGSIENEFDGLLPKAITDEPLVRRLYSYAGKGSATTRQLQDLASKLGKSAHSQMTSASGDRQVGMALYQVKDIADDLIERGLSPEKQAAFSAARQQYRMLSMLTSRGGVIEPASGNVSGLNLANLLQSKDKAGFLFGKNQSPMYNAARFSRAFRPIVNDSGTATRSPLMGTTDFILSLPIRASTAAYASQPVVNAAAMVGSGLFPNMNPAAIPAISRAGGLLGGVGTLGLPDLVFSKE